MILGYSIFEILCLLLVYACMGWCLEVAYAALETGKFVNRGFLNGPVCPIYGVGAVIVILCLTPLSENVFLLFAGAAIVTSVLELVTGFALDKLFKTRWWDYSEVPFNIGGYICLKFSILWGLVCIALMRGIHPVIYGIVHNIFKNNNLIAILILVFLLAVFATDIIITFITVNNLSKRVRLMDDIAKKIHRISDEIGGHIYDGTIAAVKKGEEIKESDKIKEITEEAKERREKREKEIAELKEKYEKMAEERHITHKRILKAFPKLKSRNHAEHIEKLRSKLTKRKK